MIKNGKGGANTLTGLHFEKRISLKVAFEGTKGYSVEGNAVSYLGRKVAELYPKHRLYKELLGPNGVDYRKIISKKLLPDDAVFILKNKSMFIVEIKFQEVAGSVDEKLQTCGFKKQQYEKLLAPLGIKVVYTYVFNDWFRKPEYKDSLEYVKNCGCHYFFNDIPLGFFGLPSLE
jgi:hypothetical protein